MKKTQHVTNEFNTEIGTNSFCYFYAFPLVLADCVNNSTIRQAVAKHSANSAAASYGGDGSGGAAFAAAKNAKETEKKICIIEWSTRAFLFECLPQVNQICNLIRF